MYAPKDHPMVVSNNYFLTPSTYKTLELVNNRVAASTAYNDNYSRPTRSARQVNGQLLLSHLDSRGKYARLPCFSSVSQQLECDRVKQLQQVGNTHDQATQTQPDEEFNTFLEPQINETELKAILIDDSSVTTIRPPSEQDSYLHPSSVGSTSSYQFLDTANCSSHHVHDSYSKTEAMKQFHLQYPDYVPDLRDFTSGNGRKHIINGYHAYYWH